LLELLKEPTNKWSVQAMQNTKQVHEQMTMIETPLDTLVYPLVTIDNTLLRS